MKLIDELQEFINKYKKNPFIELKVSDIVEFLYKREKGNLLQIFLYIDKLSKENIKKELNLSYQGLQDGIHNMTSLAKYLLEDKTSKQAKGLAKFLFLDDNIAFTINIMKAYFPDGKVNRASNNGRWFYTKFVNMIKKNKEKYLKGGDSYNWAKSYNHINYINLILSNNED